MELYENLQPRVIQRAVGDNGQLDLLKFWAANENKMPGLAKCARAEASAIVTEASSERTFSAAGSTIDNRDTLRTSKVEAIVYCRRNKRFMPPVADIIEAYRAK